MCRSEVVEHEVLPSARDRLALTLWVSGRGSLQQPLPIPPRPRQVSPATASTSSGNTMRPVSDGDGCVGTDSAPSLCSMPGDINGRCANALEDSSSFALTPTDVEQHASCTIFVAIASYRDSELIHTLRSIFRSADRPERVSVGVVLQIYPTDDAQVYSIGDGAAVEAGSEQTPLATWLLKNVRVCHMDAAAARGPCPARALCGGLWAGEQYFLQIDAHMRFRRSWDTYLLQQHDQALGQVRRGHGCTDMHFPVLTTYPPGYSLRGSCAENTGDDAASTLSDIRPTILVSL